MKKINANMYYIILANPHIAIFIIAKWHLKRLCNACGLRWAKKAKRQANSNGNNGGGSTQIPPSGIDTGGGE